ncbi:MAG: TatD family hydrolase [Pyrinomonadaceae bacterium]
MYIDSHAHIDGPEFDLDRDDVVARAQEAGVTVIMNVCSGDPHSGSLQRAAALANSIPNVYAAVGVHPHDAKLFDDSIAEILSDLIRTEERVLAWGEIGLDYHYDHSPREVQGAVFERQLELARDLQAPVIIHSRSADDDTVKYLRESHDRGWAGGIMHCFGGSEAMADQVLELGMLVSFAGNVTFKKADELRAAAVRVPLDRLLIETDCPFLTPVPYRGQRNEPARVVEVAKFLAELFGVSPEELGRRTSENFARFFKLEVGG